MLEPLFLLSARPPKQIEGELSAGGARASLLPSGAIACLRLLPLRLGHEIVLFAQIDADWIFLVPQTLPGQVLGQEVHLEETHWGC